MHLRHYAHQHSVMFALILVWIWISLSMIIRMWLKYRKDPLFKKLGWSIILCIPCFGWLFYGAFYSPLGENSTPISPSAGVMSGGYH
jgi:hypothetical protein